MSCYSGGYDHATRFWCRNRPGDQARDKYNAFHAQGSSSTFGIPLPYIQCWIEGNCLHMILFCSAA